MTAMVVLSRCSYKIYANCEFARVALVVSVMAGAVLMDLVVVGQFSKPPNSIHAQAYFDQLSLIKVQLFNIVLLAE